MQYRICITQCPMCSNIYQICPCVCRQQDALLAERQRNSELQSRNTIADELVAKLQVSLHTHLQPENDCALCV